MLMILLTVPVIVGVLAVPMIVWSVTGFGAGPRARFAQAGYIVLTLAQRVFGILFERHGARQVERLRMAQVVAVQRHRQVAEFDDYGAAHRQDEGALRGRTIDQAGARPGHSLHSEPGA